MAEETVLEAPERRPPRVRARSRGTVNDLLSFPVEKLRELYGDDYCYRWVYDPEDGKDFNAVLKRQTQGYEFVEADADQGIRGHGSTGTRVRVGDVSLMRIRREWHEEEEEARFQEALDEALRPQQVYEESLRRHAEATGASITPIGDIKTSTEVREVKMPSGDEE